MKNLDDILWISGCALVVIGVGMISIPAAFITAGVAFIAAGVMVAKANNNAPAKPTEEQ